MNVGGASAPRPLSYKQALSWLYSLQRFGIKLGLDNIRRLIAELNVDLAGARVIHVAGTNGKGSVCAMIDSICRAGGFTTGLFTSPHLVTFRERIRVAGEMIPEEAAATGVTSVRELVRGWDPHPTFFEVTTALALKHFSESKIDICILETGLGGRLDATNAVQSHVAVLTPVDLDHQKWLGESLAQIAGEKAGIIKPQTPVVSAPQQSEAEGVIRKHAAECDAPLRFVDREYDKSPVALRGPHQKLNAAIAVAGLHATNIDIDDSAVAHGLASVEWPARFQRWDERLIIDGAHNPAAARVLVKTWREVFGDQRATLILAVLSDKDVRAICAALAPIVDLALLPRIRSERAAAPEEVRGILNSAIPSLPHSITPSIAEAVRQARRRRNRILLTGSLHFAGEALACLQGRPAAFEESAQ